MDRAATIGRAMLALAGLVLATSGARAADESAYFVHIAEQGDTVYDLAAKYLQRPNDWERLRRLNRIEQPTRMPIGTQVRIPIAWMRAVPASANVVLVQGEATSRAATLQPGMQLREGSDVRTGTDGYVTLQLPDGSQLKVQAQSDVALDRLRAFQGTDMHESAIGLKTGSVDALAAKQRGPAARFVIRTPSAAAGVRGTDFRVGILQDSKATRSEVLTGVVDVNAAGQSAGPVAVAAGFGTVVAPNEKPAPPVRLLGAPNLSDLPALQERVSFRLVLHAVPSASGYRTRVAADADFNRVLADVVSRTPEALVSNLPDADYWLAVRAINELGLEGIDATRTFRLKARPEPPLIRSPQDKGVTRGGATVFEWTTPVGISRFHFQLARDPAFADLVVNDDRVTADRRAIDDLPPAEYWWRIASIRPDDDHGPFSDPRAFSRRAPPSTPQPPETDDKTMTISWSGEPGQTFLFQMARDAAFADIVDSATLAEPRITRPKPEPGTYFVRTQATDPDGFVGPFSSVQQFTIAPPETPPYWLLLLPLIPILFSL